MQKFSGYIRLAIRICFLLLLLFVVSEAGKTKSIAKNVLKATVLNSAMGKMHKPHYRRGFPVWAIVLLVLGGFSGLGLMVFLYCLFRRQQFCWRPTAV